MSSFKFDVLKGVAKINGNQYPMYCGFLPANLLIKIAEVPSFPVDKPHHKIADDVIKPPIDEWQRPEDQNKVMAIKEIYGDSLKDNLMANPVLLGTAIQNLMPPKVEINLTQKTIKTSDGQMVVVPNCYEVEVSYEADGGKPIWILDGQHRIKGLSVSTQKDELVPFVLLHDTSKYSPPFLAEIFTHVTTGAKPMEPVHGEWMKYAFNLEQYKQKSHKSSMETTIILCKEPILSNMTNPFSNKIQFNPYIQPTPKWNAFDFNSIEWEKIVASYYYGKGGKLSPNELAEEIVKATIAFENNDAHRNTDSKLFSNSNTHKMIAESYLIGLLTYLSTINKQTPFDGWVSFFLEPRRAVNKCNFLLPFVKSTAALSSSFSKPSKQVATDAFIEFFCEPNNLNGQVFTDFIQGIGGQFVIDAYQVTSTGRKDNKTKISKTIPYGSGIIPFDLSTGGITRELICIQSTSSNLYLLSVSDFNHKPTVELKHALTQKGENVGKFPNNYEIDIIYMSYSGDTKRVTQIRLDK